MTYCGKPVACIGDIVSCPKCKGTHRILEGAMNPPDSLDGVLKAVEGCITDCGAVLISVGQDIGFYDGELGLDVASVRILQDEGIERKKAAEALDREYGTVNSAVAEGATVVRVVPSNQIEGHFGIFSYVEKVDGSVLPETNSLRLNGTHVLKKWMSPDRKRIYFIPKEISRSDEMYFDGVAKKLEGEVFSTINKICCIDSMKEQMKVLKEFRQVYKEQEAEHYNNALYSAHMRYWRVLEYIERLCTDAESQDYLLSAMQEIEGA
jgi:hypothetical protein